jgi:hypothetical protein
MLLELKNLVVSIKDTLAEYQLLFSVPSCIFYRGESFKREQYQIIIEEERQRELHVFCLFI